MIGRPERVIIEINIVYFIRYSREDKFRAPPAMIVCLAVGTCRIFMTNICSVLSRDALFNGTDIRKPGFHAITRDLSLSVVLFVPHKSKR